MKWYRGCIILSNNRINDGKRNVKCEDGAHFLCRLSKK